MRYDALIHQQLGAEHCFPIFSAVLVSRTLPGVASSVSYSLLHAYQGQQYRVASPRYFVIPAPDGSDVPGVAVQSFDTECADVWILPAAALYSADCPVNPALVNPANNAQDALWTWRRKLRELLYDGAT